MHGGGGHRARRLLASEDDDGTSGQLGSGTVHGFLCCVFNNRRSLGRTGCAHWDTRDFPGRGLSKGTAIDYAASHMPPRLPAVLPQGCLHCFEPGRWPRASRAGSRSPGIVFFLSSSSAAGYWRNAARLCVLPGWATISLFPMSSSPVLRCRTHQCRSILTLGSARPTMPASVGTMIWIVARHVKHLLICVRLSPLANTFGDDLPSV